MTMPEFYDVLFEVSSETRYKIIVELKAQKAGITHISKALEISQAEASRHFRRLSQIGIIEKDPDGLYAVTLFGDLVLRLLNPFGFISEHYEYFQTHNLSKIPLQFISRMHELDKGRGNYRSRANIMGVQENISRVGNSAEEYVNIIFDEAMTEYIMHNDPEQSASGSFNPTSKPNIKFRVILPESFNPDDISEKLRSKYVELIQTEDREYRKHPNPGVVLHSSEKEISILSFPLPNWEFDYLGFEATDEASLKWTKDLFDYYWAKSSPVHI